MELLLKDGQTDPQVAGQTSLAWRLLGLVFVAVHTLPVMISDIYDLYLHRESVCPRFFETNIFFVIIFLIYLMKILYFMQELNATGLY